MATVTKEGEVVFTSEGVVEIRGFEVELAPGDKPTVVLQQLTRVRLARALQQSPSEIRAVGCVTSKKVPE